MQERKALICVDCRAEFRPPKETGNFPERCEPCRAERIKALRKERTKRWRAANPDRQRSIQRQSYHRNKGNPQRLSTRLVQQLRAYGLTVEDHAAMVERQGNRCAICKTEHRGRGKRLHVDHDHETGRVRGLLCGPCNVSLGGFRDDPKLLRSALKYLKSTT